MVTEERVREVVVDDIVKRELEMFSNVRMVSPSQAKETPRKYERARRIALAVLSTGTLKSYHGDLLAAGREGRNLVELRYGRLDNLVGCLNINPMIDEIMEIEERWLRSAADAGHDGFKAADAFPTRCELETYSDRTLESYYDDVMAAESVGRNLAEERFALMKHM